MGPDIGTASLRERFRSEQPREVVDPTPAAERRRLRPTERILVGLEGFISVCGLAGGAYMASHPLTMMTIEYLQGTWFHTWRWPGLALVFFVGVCPALVVAATLLRLPVATVGHLCVGAGLVAWILLEAAWVVVSPGLQVAVGAIGILILVLAVREAAGRGSHEVVH